MPSYQLLCVSHAKPGPEKTPETRARRANSSYTSMSVSQGLAYTGQQDCGPSDYPMLIHGVTPDVELDRLVPQFPLSKTDVRISKLLVPGLAEINSLKSII